MFECCKTTTDRGSVGEARAIYEFVKRGWVVSKPINDKSKYDLIVDDGASLRRVQVKTSCNMKDNGGFEVKISTSYANRNASKRRKREDEDYDLLFVLTQDGSTWLIPTAALEDARTAIVVNAHKWDDYKI